MARKRGWKGYWVCLKGTTLLFYPCDSREGRSVEAAPKHLIIVDGAIMQPIPEHPKRDYIFCLSTAFGDAYLFQAPCQVSTISLFVQKPNGFRDLSLLCKCINLKLHAKKMFIFIFLSSLLFLTPLTTGKKKLKHVYRWNWKIGSTAFIQLVLQHLHVIEEKRERCTYFKKKFSVWIKQLNRWVEKLEWKLRHLVGWNAVEKIKHFQSLEYFHLIPFPFKKDYREKKTFSFRFSFSTSFRRKNRERN